MIKKAERGQGREIKRAREVELLEGTSGICGHSSRVHMHYAGEEAYHHADTHTRGSPTVRQFSRA